VDAEYNRGRYLGPINANSAYARGYTGKGSTILVIDTGININSPEFKNKILNTIDYTRTGILDNVGHGTNVASIAAGARNGVGTEGVAYDAAKSGAPLERARKSPLLSEAPQVSTQQSQMSQPSGLYAPTDYPDRDIMHGNKLGPGAGPEVLMGAKPIEKLSDTLVKMLPFDTDGSIAILYQNALARGN
jgi:subtilisin family serine protease